MKKTILIIFPLASILFAQPNIRNVDTILTNSLKLLNANENNKTKSPNQIVDLMNNQNKLLSMFNITFYSKRIQKGNVDKYILATNKNSATTFFKLKEGSKFGIFTIDKIEDSYIKYSVSNMDGSFIKPYSIITTKEKKKQ